MSNLLPQIWSSKEISSYLKHKGVFQMKCDMLFHKNIILPSYCASWRDHIIFIKFYSKLFFGWMMGISFGLNLLSNNLIWRKGYYEWRMIFSRSTKDMNKERNFVLDLVNFIFNGGWAVLETLDWLINQEKMS